VDGDSEHQSGGVHEKVALATADLLAAAVVAAGAAPLGGPGGLAVDDRGAGRGLPARTAAQPFAQGGVDPPPGAVDAPEAEVVVDGLPRRELVGE